MSENPTFSVSVDYEEGRAMVRPSGQMDLASWDRWTAAMDVAIATAHHTIVIDMTDVSFIDSAGLHLIVDGRRKVRGLGMVFVVEHHRGMVDRVAALTGEFDGVNGSLA